MRILFTRIVFVRMSLQVLIVHITYISAYIYAYIRMHVDLLWNRIKLQNAACSLLLRACVCVCRCAGVHIQGSHTRACMYVYIYVCVCVCMYVYIYIYIYIYVIPMYISAHEPTHNHIRASAQASPRTINIAFTRIHTT